MTSLTAQCNALGCFDFALGAGDVCPWTCAEHQDFFLFTNWMRNFGPMVYNRRSLPNETNRRMRAYIEHCLLRYVRGITPELLQTMYFHEIGGRNGGGGEGGEGVFPGSELLIASYLNDYFKIMFRRHDVSPTWNRNLLSVFVKSGILACLPSRVTHGGLVEELRPFLHNSSVGPTDIVHLLAKLRHSHPGMYALHVTREAWQDILENLLVPELIGMWVGCQEAVDTAGEAAVRTAVPYVEKFETAYSQWTYETAPVLRAYVDLCTTQARERHSALEDELLAVALAPERVAEWCFDTEAAAVEWHGSSVGAGAGAGAGTGTGT